MEDNSDLFVKEIYKLRAENLKLRRKCAFYGNILGELGLKIQRCINFHKNKMERGVPFHRTIHEMEIYNARIGAYDHCLKMIFGKIRRTEVELKWIDEEPPITDQLELNRNIVNTRINMNGEVVFMEKGTVYKLYLNEENRKMLDGFKKLCGDQIDDNDIITAALNVMARDMKKTMNKKGEKDDI